MTKDNTSKKHKHAGKTEEARQRQLANLRPDAALKHGAFQRSKKDFFNEEEQALFEIMVKQYKQAYDLELPADIDLLEMAVTSYIKAQRQDRYEHQTGKPISARAKDHHGQFLQFIQALGLDRRFMLSMEHKDNAKELDIAQLFMLPKSKGEDNEKSQ